MSAPRFRRISSIVVACVVIALALGSVIQCAPAAPAQPTLAPAAPTTAPAQPTAAPPATAPEPAAEKLTLRVWWWGETEAPGLEKWLQESGELYKKDHPNVDFEFNLLSGEAMYPSFLAAAGAGNPPDLQVLWGGVLGLEQAWNGNIRPISDFWTEEELKHIYCATRAEGAWDGKQWLIPLYMDAWLMTYNKDIFTKSGLDPENPPQTWPEFVAALEKIKAAGFTPFAFGIKDGYFGAWWPSLLGTHKYDSITDLHKAVVGEEKLTDDKHAYWWGLWKEILDKGLTNDDANSITLAEAGDMFLQGNVGVVMQVQPVITNYARQMGEDKVGVMVPPKAGDGKLGFLLPVPGVDLAIPTKAAHPEEAADFLRFLNTPERINAQYKQSGAISPNDQIDPAVVTLPTDQLIVKWVKERPGPTYNWNYPGDFETALYEIGQALVSGSLTAEEAAQRYEEAAQKWRENNPQAVENFKKWVANPLVCE